MAIYSKELKKTMCVLVCEEKQSTVRTAERFTVPLKTFEKWITAYNKDSKVFDANYKMSNNSFVSLDYSKMSNTELQFELMKRDVEIARLKKEVLNK